MIFVFSKNPNLNKKTKNFTPRYLMGIGQELLKLYIIKLKLLRLSLNLSWYCYP